MQPSVLVTPSFHPFTTNMSQRDSYPTKEDIRHIEEVSHSEKDVTVSSSDVYASPSRTQDTGRFAKLRCVVVSFYSDFAIDHHCRRYFQEPPIPAGEFITRYPNRWSRFRYQLSATTMSVCLHSVLEKSSANPLLSFWEHSS